MTLPAEPRNEAVGRLITDAVQKRTAAGYTLPQLRKLLHLAKELGFADDVAHWEREIETLTNRSE